MYNLKVFPKWWIFHKQNDKGKQLSNSIKFDQMNVITYKRVITLELSMANYNLCPFCWNYFIVDNSSAEGRGKGENMDASFLATASSSSYNLVF